MHQANLQHYLSFSTYTYPGAYLEQLKNDLPNDIQLLGELVRKNLIHRSTLVDGNTGTNADLRFGDMTKIPWYRQPEDDVLPTVGAMLTELYRRDTRGIIADRAVEDKLILTCRYTALLTAAILKAKGIPARVRAGHAAYFACEKETGISADHWINQYWLQEQNRWVTIDVDGSLSLAEDFDPYDMPNGTFDFPSQAWMAIRQGKVDPLRFWNAKPERGIQVVLWSLFYDFHCLMNNEILYIYGPRFGNPRQLANASPAELAKIDHLARLMLDPDLNFPALLTFWQTEKDFRLLNGGLL